MDPNGDDRNVNEPTGENGVKQPDEAAGLQRVLGQLIVLIDDALASLQLAKLLNCACDEPKTQDSMAYEAKLNTYGLFENTRNDRSRASVPSATQPPGGG